MKKRESRRQRGEGSDETRPQLGMGDVRGEDGRKEEKRRREEEEEVVLLGRLRRWRRLPIARPTVIITFSFSPPQLQS